MTERNRRRRPVIDSVKSARIDAFAELGRAGMENERTLTKRLEQMMQALSSLRGLGATLDGAPIALVLIYDKDDRISEAGTLIVEPAHRRHDLALVMAAIIIVRSYFLKRLLIATIDEDNVAMLHILEHFGARVLEPDLDAGVLAAAPREVQYAADYPYAAIKAARILTDPYIHARFDIRHRVWSKEKLRKQLIELANRPLPEDDEEER